MDKSRQKNKTGAGERYLQYMMGWHCGAGVRSIDQVRAHHPDKEMADLYFEGWKAGKEASRAEAQRAGERFGYQPSIIFSAEQ